MSYQNVSYNLPQADIDSVKAALTTIEEKLPFLIALSSDERKNLFKLGPKSLDFVQAAIGAVGEFPDIVPPSFNKTEFAKDTSLFTSLTQIKFRLDSICERIDDTTIAVGSEAMTASLEVYAYVQTAGSRTPGLKVVADRLKERFRGQTGRRSRPENEV